MTNLICPGHPGLRWLAAGRAGSGGLPQAERFCVRMSDALPARLVVGDRLWALLAQVFLPWMIPYGSLSDGRAAAPRM
jgi:hypothetical protein